MKNIMYEKTKIRLLNAGDLDNIMTWVNDPEIVGRYAYFTEEITKENEAKWLKEKIESTTDIFYAIEDKDGNYLGNVAIEKIHWPAKHGQLSITIGNKEERGKGHGYRAINLILDHAFNEHGLHKILLIVAIDNHRGRHLFKKCGFVDEGLFKEHYVIDGKFIDMYAMRILEQEFKNLREVK